MKRTFIGYYIVKEQRKVTRLYECAAWWTAIQIEPQAVPLYLLSQWESAEYSRYGGHWSDRWLVATLHGANVGENFRSHFGGVGYGTWDQDKNLGRAETYGLQFYPYSLRELVDEGTVALLPTVTLAHREWWSTWQGGQQYGAGRIEWIGPRAYWHGSDEVKPLLALTYQP